MSKKALLKGMCRACIEYAQHVRENREPHWRRKWEKAMQDATLTRKMFASVEK